jgi:hypothetical protein
LDSLDAFIEFSASELSKARSWALNHPPKHRRRTRGHLSYTPTHRPQFKKLARACTCISFGLLVLTAVSLVTSPFTQGVWTWDRFLRGGQDFESGVLLVLVSFCLLFLLAQLFKRAVNLVLAAYNLSARTRGGPAVQGLGPVSRRAGDLSPPARNYRLPLTI